MSAGAGILTSPRTRQQRPSPGWSEQRAITLSRPEPSTDPPGSAEASTLPTSTRTPAPTSSTKTTRIREAADRLHPPETAQWQKHWQRTCLHTPPERTAPRGGRGIQFGNQPLSPPPPRDIEGASVKLSYG